MTFLTFRDRLLQDWLYGFRQWERERIAEAVIALLNDPQPPSATPIPSPAQGGERYQISVADRRVTYNVYQDDAGLNQMIVVREISEAIA